MSIPDPKPGLVVRYDYLWSREAAVGRDHGKERPTCIVAATDDLASPRYVVLLPITHSPPSGASVGIAIPLNVKRKIGLDDEPSSDHHIRIQCQGMAERRPFDDTGQKWGFRIRLHPAWPLCSAQDAVS